MERFLTGYLIEIRFGDEVVAFLDGKDRISSVFRFHLGPIIKEMMPHIRS